MLEDFSLALSNLGDAATLSRSEAKRLRRLARKNSSVLIGYLVALFRRDGVIMGKCIVDFYKDLVGRILVTLLFFYN